ncbi:putative uncharacterized protein DDB_G0270496 [Eupeodes corollae]|uniref:putative uncharacterized protein DDB_G0270496 n=1 Tax=Eupeodes corollae TaxID=290404 RepID=UPI002493B7E2|nr:putative uncharacterized protein DDB_G0270496 [Eupeodes corollae]
MTGSSNIYAQWFISPNSGTNRFSENDFHKNGIYDEDNIATAAADAVNDNQHATLIDKPQPTPLLEEDFSCLDDIKKTELYSENIGIEDDDEQSSDSFYSVFRINKDDNDEEDYDDNKNDYRTTRTHDDDTDEDENENDDDALALALAPFFLLLAPGLWGYSP